MLGINAGGDFKMKPMLIYYSQIPGSISVMIYLLCMCSTNRTTKPGWQYIYLKQYLLNIWSQLLRPIAQKDFFQNIDNALLQHLRALTEMYKKIYVVFMAANITPIFYPVGRNNFNFQVLFKKYSS